MIVQVYSIHDMQLNTYSQPMIFEKPELAKRSVIMALSSGESMLKSFSGNYRLVKVGEWDNELGLMVPQPQEVICTVEELLHSIPKPKIAIQKS